MFVCSLCCIHCVYIKLFSRNWSFGQVYKCGRNISGPFSQVGMSWLFNHVEKLVS